MSVCLLFVTQTQSQEIHVFVPWPLLLYTEGAAGIPVYTLGVLFFGKQLCALGTVGEKV